MRENSNQRQHIRNEVCALNGSASAALTADKSLGSLGHVLPRPDKAEPLLPFLERAVARTEVAPDAPTLQLMPAFRRHIHECHFGRQPGALEIARVRAHYTSHFLRA